MIKYSITCETHQCTSATFDSLTRREQRKLRTLRQVGTLPPHRHLPSLPPSLLGALQVCGRISGEVCIHKRSAPRQVCLRMVQRLQGMATAGAGAEAGAGPASWGRGSDRTPFCSSCNWVPAPALDTPRGPQAATPAAGPTCMCATPPSSTACSTCPPCFLSSAAGVQQQASSSDVSTGWALQPTTGRPQAGRPGWPSSVQARLTGSAGGSLAP